MNPKVDGKRHRFSWGVIDDHGMLRLTKQDHETHEVVKWTNQDVSRELPWQPVFVPEPYSDSEDAGVVLSFVRDQPTGDSFCVVLDVITFRSMAMVPLCKGSCKRAVSLGRAPTCWSFGIGRCHGPENESVHVSDTDGGPFIFDELAWR